MSNNNEIRDLIRKFEFSESPARMAARILAILILMNRRIDGIRRRMDETETDSENPERPTSD